MKIVFLCGSLEAGCDGVGDYTRVLARQLTALGHNITCIAINDSLLQSSNYSISINKDSGRRSFKIIRFSQSLSWFQKIKRTYRILQRDKPDWISLQYVPYSFNRYGIPLLFTLLSYRLRGPWRTHIMFHELWIDGQASLKAYFTSTVQKLLIRAIKFTADPSVVHTSIGHYSRLLSRIGIHSGILPLHGNIAVNSTARVNPAILQDWTFVFFGSLDRKWMHEPLYSFIEQARQQSGINKCSFVRIGRATKAQLVFWSSISNSEICIRYPHFKFFDIGELTESDVSLCLLNSSFGISMAPLQWIGKSGSVAAMIDHGLQVIVPTYRSNIPEPLPHELPFAECLLPIDHNLPKRLLLGQKHSVDNSIERTAAQLLQNFRSAT